MDIEPLYYFVIGVMSGTSLDGVDIAYCVFRSKGRNWKYEIRKAETIPYNAEWRSTLTSLQEKNAFELVSADAAYGRYLGELVNDFVRKHKIVVDLVASHGHTIFHQPGKGVTAQIGSGASLSAASGLTVVCDFRSQDVALGGQGAPLVPVGDHFLFSEYDYCLNLGGIANISCINNGERIAYDICPVNMVLNALAGEAGLSFDADGKLARDGRINTALLQKLNALDYYGLKHPKSLGREWVENTFLPVLNKHSLSTGDKLSTCCEHMAIQISKAVAMNGEKGKIYITGGGAFNKFLVERISSHTKAEVALPDPSIINYKEALIFAFLGVLRWRGEINCFKSVTGATRNSCCGAIYLNG